MSQVAIPVSIPTYRFTQPVYPSILDATIALLGGRGNTGDSASGVKNIITKPVGLYDSFCKLTGEATTTLFGRNLTLFAQTMEQAKGVLGAREAISKFGWYKDVVPFASDVHQGKKGLGDGKKLLRNIADWTMAAKDSLYFLHTTGMIALSKSNLYFSQWVFTGASTIYSTMNLKDACSSLFVARTTKTINIVEIEGDKTKSTNVKSEYMIQRTEKKERPISTADEVASMLSIAVSVCYIAYSVLSLPALLGWTITASATALFYIKTTQWACMAVATFSIIGSMYLNEMRIKPLDAAYTLQIPPGQDQARPHRE
jgi:hypothetical protein